MRTVRAFIDSRRFERFYERCAQMATDSSALPKANGLKTVLDTIVAPKDAFEALRTTPTFGWALSITIVLSALATYLMVPAIQHGLSAGWADMMAKNPQTASLTPAQTQMQLAIASKFVSFNWVFAVVIVPIYCLIEAVVMLIFNAIGRGSGSFVKYFAAACNIAVPVAGIGNVVLAAIVLMRGAESFSTPQSVQWAMPSLAFLAPAGNIKLTALLATVTPFTIWAFALSIAAMLIIGRIPKLQAWLAGIVLFLVPAIFAVAFAK